jgi:hypothetical protein
MALKAETAARTGKGSNVTKLSTWEKAPGKRPYLVCKGSAAAKAEQHEGSIYIF